MKILCSALYESQLKEILSQMLKQDVKSAKDFKLYLDTIVMNVPTKAKKYKKSIFFDDESIKDIEYDGYKIPFYIDEIKSVYLILGIYK